MDKIKNNIQIIKKKTKNKNEKHIAFNKAIKSIINLKFIFSFIIEKKRLNIIKYNKDIQKKLGIDIERYKKKIDRYIIVDRNGCVREYILDTNILIFEGRYLNDKRNGKGEEYDFNGRRIFKGEFLNGKRNGNGKEYFYNNQVKFEGEYLKGKIWNGICYNYYENETYKIKNGSGYIKEYDSEGVLKFEGEYLNGERNGKGKEYHLGGKYL